MSERLFEGADWDFTTIQRIHDACEEIALKDAMIAALSERNKRTASGVIKKAV